MITDQTFDELTTGDLYGILQLRNEVFVVEQHCAYADLDGRDREPGTRHIWVARDGRVGAYVRVLNDTAARRIGRVVTQPELRGNGLAAQLIDYVLASGDGPWVLDAQAHLHQWYARFGFVTTGPEFLEDGIPHLPMRREAAN